MVWEDDERRIASQGVGGGCIMGGKGASRRGSVKGKKEAASLSKR